MTIQFNINYNTSFGEELLLNVIVPTEDGQEKTAVFGMSTADGRRWQYTLNNIDAVANPHIDYYFSLSNAGKELSREWITVTHRLDLNMGGATNITVNNRWNEIPHDSYLYTSAYTDCINRHPRHSVGRSAYSRTVRLIVRAPQLRLGERLAIVGEHASMGEWNTEHAIPMHEHNCNEWQIDLNANALGVPQPANKGAEAVPMKGLEYKFIAVSTDGKVMWETCDNRTLKLDAMAAGDVCVIEEDQSFFAMCNRRLSGTLVPLFSLRTEGSFGIGDFGDLAAMVDFVADTGQRVLQLLPINDTTTTRRWTDSYPYSCISIFALNPIYVDLRQLPPLADAKQQAEFEALRQELNALPAVDYERVIRAKEQYMHLMFEQESERTMRSAAFKKFFRDNEYWLVPYAQYSYLRDAYGTADFNTWPSHREWTEAERGQLSNPRTKAYKKLAFFYYLQFVLDQQMSAAHEHAMARGVILKGDIPIGVDRTGCDVWFEPQYFNLDGQAGAPPDAFSVNGQNWGFPTYNWDRMLADGCQWWVRRFRNMAKYFDAYRIDHVLGFFRIWDIPVDCVHGLLGQFSPALPMTKAEIGSYGFEFDEERHTRPFINKWVLERIFGERALDVAEKYLQPIAEDGTFSMRPEYDTERKVQAAFAGKNSAADTALRDGLYKLIENVLFVRDRKRNYLYHPRITAHLTFAYAALSDDDKQRFYRLYDDYYYRRNSMFWYREAMKKLPRLVQATRMLVCAEDLGMVPESVDWVMKDLRILSLNVQTMPKEYGVRFADLSKYPYRSVCLFSSHDMPTLRLWWDEDKEVAQDYYESVLYHTGAAPHPLPGWLAREIIVRQMQTPSMLCIVQLQDWLATDERIRQADPTDERVNVPANPFHYWRYRMPMTIESLKADRDFVNSIKDIVDETGRY